MNLEVQVNWLVQLAARGLNRVFPGNSPTLTAKLYTNDVTPTVDNALGDFVEAVGGGYVPQSIAATFVNARNGAVVESAPPDVAFAFTGALTGPSDVVGVYLVDAGGALVAAGRLAEARTPAANTRLTVPLTLAWGSGATAEPAGNAAPTAPVLSLVGVASGQATVRLDTASSDADGTVAGYILYVDGSPVGGLRSWVEATNQTLSGLANGVQVTITAKAQDNDGALSDVSNVVNATPANHAPTAAVIAIGATGDSQVTVRLVTASTDTESGTITTYQVLVNGVPYGSDQTGWSAGTDRTIGGLTNGVQVALSVKGRDGEGLLGAGSNGISVTPSSAQDTIPDQFTFADQTGVAVSSTITSDPVTITGISAATVITVASGTYSINGGSYTASAGSVNNGDLVRARHTSSASFSTATYTTVTIGGVSDTFASTTVAEDAVPNAFSFADQTDVALSSVIESNAITVAGINTASPISVEGGSYQINGGAWVTSAGTVTNGNTVKVRHTSSGSYTTDTLTTLTIGGVSDTFTTTTAAMDTTPNAFTFSDLAGVEPSAVVESNAITVAGINAAAAISVSGGEYSINGGAYTSAAGTVSVGNTVRARVTASASFLTAANVTVTIGGVGDTFTATTRGDGVADDFSGDLSKWDVAKAGNYGLNTSAVATGNKLLLQAQGTGSGSCRVNVTTKTAIAWGAGKSVEITFDNVFTSAPDRANLLYLVNAAVPAYQIAFYTIQNPAGTYKATFYDGATEFEVYSSTTPLTGAHKIEIVDATHVNCWIGTTKVVDNHTIAVSLGSTIKGKVELINFASTQQYAEYSDNFLLQ